MVELEAAFRHLHQLCPALSIYIQLNRLDFPMVAFPDAVAKETLFRAQIHGMAQGAMTMGALGSGVVVESGVFGGQGGGGGGGHTSFGTGKLAAKVG
jgi:hypothetical protein